MIVEPLEFGLRVRAPAKLNLFLEVLGRRSDGYHEIESLMVTVDLYDTLTFQIESSGAIHLVCDDPTLPTDGTNLVIKAAERLRAEVNQPLGAAIDLRKLIPAQAGLAGGSSDAAATLVGLNLLWDLKLPTETLVAIASEIGSDVAFFLHGPAAICRGRGEIVEPIDVATLPPLHFVLVCPPLGVGTADVYRRLVVPDRPRPIGPIVEALLGGDSAALGSEIFNRLQPVAESLEPELIRVREAWETLGPSYLEGHAMSGSGSASFGLARTRDAAWNAADRFGATGLGKVHVVACSN